jgi:hypothetical protein
VPTACRRSQSLDHEPREVQLKGVNAKVQLALHEIRDFNDAECQLTNLASVGSAFDARKSKLGLTFELFRRSMHDRRATSWQFGEAAALRPAQE